jgi:hypothetical protein
MSKASLLIRELDQSFPEVMINLSKEEQTLTIGGACTYAGTSYSTGSNKTMPGTGGGEITKTCTESGTWA